MTGVLLSVSLWLVRIKKRRSWIEYVPQLTLILWPSDWTWNDRQSYRLCAINSSTFLLNGKHSKRKLHGHCVCKHLVCLSLRKHHSWHWHRVIWLTMNPQWSSEWIKSVSLITNDYGEIKYLIRVMRLFWTILHLKFFVNVGNFLLSFCM